MVFEKVRTVLRPGEIIDPKLKETLISMISAVRRQDYYGEKQILEQFEILSNLSHSLACSLIKEYETKARDASRRVGKNAERIGIERAVSDAKSTVRFYNQLIERIQESEREGKYASLDLQHQARASSKRLANLNKDINRYKRLLLDQKRKQEKDMQKRKDEEIKKARILQIQREDRLKQVA